MNDLPALHAADLGIGLGPGEAVIGSPVVSLRMSISGTLASRHSAAFNNVQLNSSVCLMLLT